MIRARYHELFAEDGTTLLERTIDNGDGTGIYTVYNDDGTEKSSQHLTNLPVIHDENVLITQRVAELEKKVEHLTKLIEKDIR